MRALPSLILMIAFSSAAGVLAAKPPASDDTILPSVHDVVAHSARPNALDAEPTLRSDSWGLALSGGGVRSAAYAMGALAGLQKTGLLDQVEVISSVSGGGYAAYWYFMRLRNAGFPAADDKQRRAAPFYDCIPYWWVEPTKYNAEELRMLARDGVTTDGLCANGRMPAKLNRVNRGPADASFHWTGPLDSARWQLHLAQRMDLFSDDAEHLTGVAAFDGKDAVKKELLRLFVKSGAQQTVNLFRLPEEERSASREFYEMGIERSFGLEPKSRQQKDLVQEPNCWHSKWTYVNARLTSSSPCRPDPRPSSSTKSASRIPGEAASLSGFRESMQNRVLPLWVINMSADSDPSAPSADRIFEVTPFGFGSQKHGYKRGDFSIQSTSALVATSGAVLDTQAPTGDYPGLAGPALAIMAMANGTWGRDISSYAPASAGRIHLSDGGHTENLGVYSLLRRGIKNIIVIDGSYDRKGEMSDLCRLRAYLEREGFELSLPTLENLDAVCAGAGRQDKPRYDLYAWTLPVHRGEIRKSNGDRALVSNLYYAKLAWDQARIGSIYSAYSTAAKNKSEVAIDNRCDALVGEGRGACILALYYGHNKQQCEQDSGRLIFPQYNTFRATANASGYMFWGLRELGKNAAYAIDHALKTRRKTESASIGARIGQPATTSFANFMHPHSPRCLCWQSYDGFSPKKIEQYKACG